MSALAASRARNSITSLQLALSFERREDEPSVDDDDQLFVGMVSMQLEGSRPRGYFEERYAELAGTCLATDASPAPAKWRLVSLGVPLRVEDVRGTGRDELTLRGRAWTVVYEVA